MKRALITALLLSVALVVPAFAAESGPPPSATGQTFEQKQARILKMLDERIAHLQEGKACAQAAKNNEDLRACREKQMAEMKEQRDEMRSHRGMMEGGPAGHGPQGK